VAGGVAGVAGISRGDGPMAEVIKVDGTRVAVTPKNGTDFTFQEVYPLIGTDIIEVAEATDGRIILLDEEGKLKGKPINKAATELYKYAMVDGRPWDVIVGDVLVCADSEVK
jgi:hypothetical protein